MLVDILIIIAIVSIIATVLWYDRKNIRVSGFIVMRHTQHGRRFIDRIANKAPRFWKAWSWTAVGVAIPAMIFISYFIINATLQFFEGGGGAVKVVLPAMSTQSLPGVLLIPWYFWIIGIALVVIPHEFSHGIVCRLRKIRISSIGWFLLAVIPGAFVEPDKKSLNNAKRSSKIQVYAAGSFANIIIAMIFLVINMGMMATFFTQNGIMISGLINGTPAASANLSGAILSINGYVINNPLDIQKALEATPIGSNAHIVTTAGEWNIITVKHPNFNRSYIGIAGPYEPNYEVRSEFNAGKDVLMWFLSLFGWLFTISLGIGLFNLLPIKPLDGGLIFEEIMRRFIKKKSAVVVKIVTVLMAMLVLVNIIGPVAIGR